jgi:hypothetical protein
VNVTTYGTRLKGICNRGGHTVCAGGGRLLCGWNITRRFVAIKRDKTGGCIPVTQIALIGREGRAVQSLAAHYSDTLSKHVTVFAIFIVNRNDDNLSFSL